MRCEINRFAEFNRKEKRFVDSGWAVHYGRNTYRFFDSETGSPELAQVAADQFLVRKIAYDRWTLDLTVEDIQAIRRAFNKLDPSIQDNFSSCIDWAYETALLATKEAH